MKMQDFMIEIDDILNENLMPMSLVVLENNVDSSVLNISSRSIDDEDDEMDTYLDGTNEQFGTSNSSGLQSSG